MPAVTCLPHTFVIQNKSCRMHLFSVESINRAPLEIGNHGCIDSFSVYNSLFDTHVFSLKANIKETMYMPKIVDANTYNFEENGC